MAVKLADLTLTKAELEALTQALSNDARILYCLGLRPNANLESGESSQIDYKALIPLVNGKAAAKEKQKYSLGRQINSLLKELQKAGLIALDQLDSLERSMAGKQVFLPLLMFTPDQFAATHIQWQSMAIDWQPDETVFQDICQLVGLIDKAYAGDELGEFVAYWMGRPEKQFSQYQWTHKFVMQLKQRRLARGSSDKVKIGMQLADNSASVQADENTKALVKKYNK